MFVDSLIHLFLHILKGWIWAPILYLKMMYVSLNNSYDKKYETVTHSFINPPVLQARGVVTKPSSRRNNNQHRVEHHNANNSKTERLNNTQSMLVEATAGPNTSTPLPMSCVAMEVNQATNTNNRLN